MTCLDSYHQGDLIVFQGHICHVLTVDIVLQTLPQTGQLLGRLNISHTVRGCPELYSKTIQCIKCLWRAKPQTVLERKASEWAMGQMKSSVCLPKPFYYNVCQLGVSPQNVITENTNQLTRHIRDKLRDKYKQRKQEALTCSSTLEPDALPLSVIPSLLNAPINSPLMTLWEDVIDVLMLYPLQDPASKMICQELVKAQMLEKGFRPCLTPETLHKLWTFSRSALEQEVLFRVDKCSQCVLPTEMDDVWNDSCLIKVCIQDEFLYGVVCHMLTTLVKQCNLEILSSFLRCIWLTTTKSPSQDIFALCRRYPSSFRKLVILLSVHPEEIKSESLGPHMASICDIFSEILANHGERTEILILSLQFIHWYQMAIQFCFVCSRQYLSCSLDLIACFSNVWFKVQHQPVKDVLTRVLLCLRPLMVKSTLCFTDVMCVLSGNQVNSQGQMKNILYQILLMFMFQSSGGLNILKPILQLVTSSDSTSDHMICLMISHNQLKIDFSKWTVVKIKQYSDILSDFMDKCEKDVHPNVRTAVKVFLDKTCVL